MTEGGKLFAKVGDSLQEVVFATTADLAKLPYPGKKQLGMKSLVLKQKSSNLSHLFNKYGKQPQSNSLQSNLELAT